MIWLAAQKNAFQAAMNGESLDAALAILIAAVQRQADNELRCAFYIFDGAGGLQHVVGMSERYAEQVNGLAISRDSLSCGLAVANGAPVITPDVLEDPRWAPWTWLAREHGYRACWSFPVELATGKVVGSFAMYHPEPREPTARDLELAAQVSPTAGILISWYEQAHQHSRAHEALQVSEERYRELFLSIDAGYSIVQMIYDEAGEPWDCRYVETNPAFLNQTGLDDAVGKTFRELIPDPDTFCIETYGRIARTRKSERYEHFASAVGRWYNVFAFPTGAPEEHRVAVLFDDITDRKMREMHVELLDQVAMDLATLSDPDQIMTQVGERVSRALGASGCVFCDVDEELNEVTIHHGWQEAEVPSLKQTFRLSEYLTAEFTRTSRAGEPFVIHDTGSDSRVDAANYARLMVGAFIVVPQLRTGRWIAYMALTSVKPRVWRDDEVDLLRELLERLFARIERARAEAALRESEARFSQFANASSGALWVRDAASLAMEYVSPAVERVYGVLPNAFVGDVRFWAGSILPEDRDLALKHLSQTRGGQAVVHEFRIQRPSDGKFRWIRDTAFPLFDEQGRVQRIGGIAEDVTEARLSEEHQHILLSELQHRVRNIMTVIRSIAARTGERAENVQDYAGRMAGRLLALSRVQALLTTSANVQPNVARLIHDELAAKTPNESQCAIEGPDITISPKAAEILTLAVHELATNALKYGALSVPDGRVFVRWNTLLKNGKSWLSFDWQETGAPAAQHAEQFAERRGFGSELIVGRIPYELGGRGTLEVDPHGAHCHLEFPIQHGASVLETGAPRQGTVSGGALEKASAARLGGHRVLVVEDEYFIAMDSARALRGAGAEVAGPCPDEQAANDEIDKHRPDAVLVDINLGHGPSFDLAHSLKKRGIPFVFVTGYDVDVIPTEFREVQRLQKPVELRHMVEAVSRLLPPAA